MAPPRARITVGVATDWSTTKLIAVLNEHGPFDQLAIDSNRTNLAVEHCIWPDGTAAPAMPHVVLLEPGCTASV